MKFLPIGSIILLKNGNKKLMIYGRFQMNLENGQIYDYVGCLYPEGNISAEYSFLFDNKDINEIVFEGYKDIDEDKYIEEVSREISND